MHGRLITTAAVAALAMAGVAQAAKTTTLTGSDWAGGTWSNGLPAAGDTAIVGDGAISNFNGQVAGHLLAGKTTLDDSVNGGTMTLNNLGSMATVVSDDDRFTVGWQKHTTLLFTDDLTITAPNRVDLYGSVAGPGTLKVDATEFRLFLTGTVAVDRLDLTEVSLVNLAGKQSGTPIDDSATATAALAGTTIELGAATVIATGVSSYMAISDTNLEMGNVYTLFNGNAGGNTYTIGSWKIGDAYLPVGTYNAASGIVAGANMGTIFASSNISIEVTAVPEPAAMALLGLGGAVLLSRRRTA